MKELTKPIIGAAIKVHTALVPGLFESTVLVYERHLSVLCASAVKPCDDRKITAEAQRARRWKDVKELTKPIIGAAIKVHTALVPGLFESTVLVYENISASSAPLR